MKARFSLPSPFLGATKLIDGREENITRIELSEGVSSGVMFRRVGGMVPVFEEHTARLERGISLDDWMKLDEYEKALVIAQRRIAIQAKNLQVEAEIQQMKKETAKAKNGRK